MEILPTIDEPRTIVQLVLIDETGDSYYRMRWPGKQVAEQAPNWRVISLDARARERFEWALHADLLIVYQTNDLDLLPLIEQRRKLGRKTLVEYNDNFYDPPPASPVYLPWSSPLIHQSYERFMLNGDGVVVTGPGLKELFAEYSPAGIFILENHLPAPPEPFSSVWNEDTETIHFGWAGSLGHIGDVAALIPLLRELLDECPNLVFHIMGNEALPSMLNLPPERLRYTSWGTMAEYYNFWRPVQIGFAPLLDTPYNRCRSDIKAVEMSSQGVLPVLANALPYQAFIEATKAPSFSSFAELKKLINSYAKSPERLKEDARRCYNYVVEKRVGTERRERLELYARMCSGAPSTYAWPMPVGYHEIQGTAQEQLKFAAILAQAQASAQQQNHSQALAVLQRALEENPYTPDVAIAELNCLRVLKRENLDPQIERYIDLFPRDLRFRLFRLITRSSVDDRISTWEETIEFLSGQSSAFRNFFQSDVVETFCRDLHRLPQLLPQGMKLVRLLPGSGELRLQVALANERAGNYREAKEQFDWLLSTRSVVLANEEFFKKVELGFLQTWQSALSARLKEEERSRIKRLKE